VEFIINAFRFANKYAPEYVELYYNDYNECTPLKSNGIVKLIEDVKAAEGTRLDAFGMQGHYDLSSPTGGQIKVAARRFAEAAGGVSITELDLKASSAFDGTDEGKNKEYRKQYYLYKEMMKGFQELKKEGVTIRTVTVWGVIDGHSWLQTQNNVGGASNGSSRQCPLLFDDDYKAKPCFYALAYEDMPEVKKVEEVTEEVTEEAAEAEAVVEEAPAKEPEDADIVELEEGNAKNRTLAIVIACVVAIAGGTGIFVKTKKSGKKD